MAENTSHDGGLLVPPEIAEEILRWTKEGEVIRFPVIDFADLFIDVPYFVDVTKCDVS